MSAPPSLDAPHSRGAVADHYRGDIEGLRAIAVVLVALGHAAVPFLAGGFVGVDVFFVISGFLITGILIRESERDGRPSLLRFYARRIRRILPLAVLVALVTVVATYQLAGAALGRATAGDAGWATLFAANLHFAQTGVDYFNRGATTSPLEHYWSLGVEEQFYLLWPLLMIAIALLAGSARARRAVTLGLLAVITVASLAFSIVQTDASPTVAYFSPLTRAFELALGALLAAGLAARPVAGPGGRAPRRTSGGSALAVLGLAAIVGAALAFDGSTAVPGYAVLLPTLGAVLVILGGSLLPAGPVSRVLGSAPLRFVGRRSYGFYLWHFPFLILPAVRWGELSAAERAGLLLASFAVACATYALVEDPVRRSAWLRARPPLISIAVGVLLVAVGLGGTQALRSANAVEYTPAAAPAPGPGLTPDAASTQDPEAPQASEETQASPSDQVVAAVAAGAELSAAPDDLDPPADGVTEFGSPNSTEASCDRTYDATTADVCYLDDVGSGAGGTTVLWGDSHAGMWIPGLMSIARETDQRLAALVHYACPPLLGVTAWHPEEDRTYDECTSYVASAIDTIIAEKPDTIILTGSYNDWYPEVDGVRGDSPSAQADQLWDQGLTASIEALIPSGAQIFVIGDISYPDQDESVCLSAHADDLARCSRPADEATFADHNASEQAAAEAAGATYISVTQWLCTATDCPPVIADRVVYRDAAHLTRQYSIYLAGVLGGALGMLPAPR